MDELAIITLALVMLGAGLALVLDRLGRIL